MPNLSELINKCCPKGVQFKHIYEIADTNIGLATSVSKNKASYGVRLLHNSDIQPNKIVIKKDEYITEAFAERNKGKLFRYHDIITVHTGDVGTSAVIEEEYVGSIGFTTITTRINNIDEVNPYYLCHYLNSSLCKKDISRETISDRSNLNQKSFAMLLVPLPPMEVQHEIVQILDKFTLLTKELTEELTEELTSRKKQYEYYKTQLLKENKHYTKMKMKDIVKVSMCRRIKKAETVTRGDVPFYQNGTLGGDANLYLEREVYEFYKSKSKLPKAGEVMLSTAGTVGKAVIYNGEEAYFQDSNIVWLSNDETIVSNQYLYWFCMSMPWALPSRVTLKHLHNYMIEDTDISVPSLDEQERIIEQFQSLYGTINEIIEKLEQEIEARQKQYEYYRDKLLAFEEVV